MAKLQQKNILYKQFLYYKTKSALFTIASF